MVIPRQSALVIVGQRNSVRAIPNPIHESKEHVIDRTFAHMIFEQEQRAAHAYSFLKEHFNIIRMMQDINEKTNIERTVWIWQLLAIKRAAGDTATGSDADLDALNCNIWAALGQHASYGSVATANIENSRARRYLLGEQFRQHARTASEYK